MRTYKTNAINPETRMDEIGLIITRGGTAVSGTPVGEVFKVLFFDVDGTVDVLGIDGNTFTVAGLANAPVFVLGVQVSNFVGPTTVRWGGGI